MSQASHIVDSEGRYDGLTLREALPRAVGEIVVAFRPREIILFGSVARGDEGPDSDLDLLVVFEHAERSERRRLMREVRRAISTFVPVDVLVADVADVADLASDSDDVGSVLYWPLREGKVVYRDTERRAG